MFLTHHTFHIPVLGIGFTIDTPAKVARFGLSSVISIIEDDLMERMRKFYCLKLGKVYEPIDKLEDDYRARRITAYLNVIQEVVDKQMKRISSESFDGETELVKYFTLLPDESELKKRFLEMQQEENEPLRMQLQETLRKSIIPGSIDVNIMTKCDKMNYDKSGEPLPAMYADAMSALRGFALSRLSSSVVFSAGMNPRLYQYCSEFDDFFADENGCFNKRIILKVSDYRSALIQGKFLAKKGLWVSEFRIESGLNCGGHAFATDGFLLGPIMEEFKVNRVELSETLYGIYKEALEQKGKIVPAMMPGLRITVQGGIGTNNEQKFLLEYYHLNGTGWGSPFLLVPEATNVDSNTLKDLSNASESDYFLSNASPLGVPFNNFRRSSSEKQRLARIDKGRPGSPCFKKYLSFNTEFTDKPICTASREYQHKKLNQLASEQGGLQTITKELVMEKDCLCEGLSVPALMVNELETPHKLEAVAICPGPNLAYFSGVFTLKQMVDHIYGRTNILNNTKRPSMFIKELRMYGDYLHNEVNKLIETATAKQVAYVETFRNNLLNGIDYYFGLIPMMKLETAEYRDNMSYALRQIKAEVSAISVPCLVS